MENCPLWLVTVDFDVPFTLTVMPGNTSPVDERSVPRMMCWAKALETMNRSVMANRKLTARFLFFILRSLVFRKGGLCQQSISNCLTPYGTAWFVDAMTAPESNLLVRT